MKTGRQNELISKAMEIMGNWEKLSDFTDTNKSYLRYHLGKEVRTLPEPLYKKLCKIVGGKYDKFVVEILDYNWGVLKGARMSPRTKPKKVDLIEPSIELAELIGIMLGDGNIYIMLPLCNL